MSSLSLPTERESIKDPYYGIDISHTPICFCRLQLPISYSELPHLRQHLLTFRLLFRIPLMILIQLTLVDLHPLEQDILLLTYYLRKQKKKTKT